MQQTSLLAHLYPYFKGSQEDVATSSLCYIVSSNEHINRAFTSHIGKILDIELSETYQYQCQKVGDNKERPDMAGFDPNGDEKILCESKFYAALTINQPNTYLKRLINEHGRGLLFICPEVRRQGLWNEILEIASKEFHTTSINGFCVEIDQSVRLGITTWKSVLNDLEQMALTNAVNYVSDIKQLQGYCEQLDREAFIPFKEEDFGMDMAMKAERPYRLLDALVEALRNEPGHQISLKRLKATPIWSGYRRYMYIDGFGVNVEYDTKKWRNSETPITPYWLSIERIVDNHWQLDPKDLLKIPSELKDGEYIALFPKKYVALSEVADDMKKQVFHYIQVFKDAEAE